MIIIINHWHVFPDEGTIVNTESGDHHKVDAKTIAVLLLLVEKKGQVVSRDEFMRRVWSGSITVEESLTRCISELRKVFGDNPKSPHYIKTVHKKGYQLLVEPVSIEAESDIDGTAGQFKLNGVSLAKTFALVGPIVVFIFWLVSEHPFGKPKPSTSTPIEIEQITPHLIASANASPEFFVEEMSGQAEYKVALNRIVNQDSHVKKIKIRVFDNHQNQIWEAERDITTELEQVVAANDLKKMFALIDDSKSPPETSELSATIQSQYKQAIYYMDKRGKDNLLKSIALFDEILNANSEFVMAFVNQAVAYRTLAFYETETDQVSRFKMRHDLLLQQAKAIAPEHPVVVALTTEINFREPNWLSYKEKLKDAIAFSPACSICVRRLAEHYLNLGYYNEAAALVKTHLDYSPLSISMHSFLGMIYSMQGRIEQVRYQVDVLNALGSNKGFDAMGLKLQLAMMENDRDTYLEQTQVMLDAHPAFAQRLRVMEALYENKIEEAQGLIKTMPFLDFNLAVSSGMTDEVIERIRTNIASGQLKDLGLTHGWLVPGDQFHNSYIKNLLELKNTQEISNIFTEIGLIDFWQANEQWPDYCYGVRYQRHRPNYCPHTPGE